MFIIFLYFLNYFKILYYGEVMLIRGKGLNGWLDELLSDPDEIQKGVAFRNP